MKERWIDIREFEGIYQISNLGRIKSVERYKVIRGIKTKVFEKIMKTQISRAGYKHIRLCKNSKKYDLMIHRLVAEAFCKKPEGKNYVDHIDGVKTNNNYKNLEWVSMAENNQRAYDTGLKRRIHAGQFTSEGGRRK